MLILDTALVKGIRFVLDKLVQAVDQELNDEGSLREQLLAAQMRFELGELTEQELQEVEKAVMERLREINERKGGGMPIEMGRGAQGEEGEEMKVAGVDSVSFGGDEEGLQALHPRPEPEKPGK
ncbi:MAG TPA: gas vesicle protein GvpG [Myxococcales bacterium]|jgi:hypothetical protein|nr:gas vesicle protein GvpG [Myxococcales bacterium]